MLNKQNISLNTNQMAQKEEKNIPTQKILINFRKKPILLARFFHLFMALAYFYLNWFSADKVPVLNTISPFVTTDKGLLCLGGGGCISNSSKSNLTRHPTSVHLYPVFQVSGLWTHDPKTHYFLQSSVKIQISSFPTSDINPKHFYIFLTCVKLTLGIFGQWLSHLNIYIIQANVF